MSSVPPSQIKPSATQPLSSRSARFLWFLSTWLPTAIGIAVIAVESTAAMSGANTSRFLRPIFTALFGAFSDPGWESLHHILRKCGHFCGYGTLSLLFSRSWYRTLRERARFVPPNLAARAAALGILYTFLTASCDEFHQRFLPGRVGAFSDVLLDTAGGLTFHLVFWLLWWRSRCGDGLAR